MERRDESEASPTPRNSQETKKPDPNFCAWMLVTRKKNVVRNGRACDTNNPNQQGEKLVKGKLVQTSKEMGPSVVDKNVNNSITISHVELEVEKPKVPDKEVKICTQKE